MATRLATAERTPATATSSSWLRRKSVQDRIVRWVALALIALGAVVVLFPFAWMLSTSLKDSGEVMLFPPRWIPSELKWSNYPKALTTVPFGRYFLNTTYISVLFMIGELLSSSLIAYGFARLRAPGSGFWFALVLATLLLPPQVTMIPTFILFKLLGWTETYKPLIIPGWFGQPFSIFLFRQFFLTIPRELDDAAKIDGCNYFSIYWRIILPQAKPALATVAIFSFIWHWNDLLQPLIYLSEWEKYTVSLGLANFTANYGGTPWELLMAASVVALLPCLVLFFAAQRYFIQGIVVSGLKG